jgi:hypothetical protein
VNVGAADVERALRDAEDLVLETRGRHTGEPHRVTIWFAYEDGDIWLRTDRATDWYRNLEREPSCRVIVGGVSYGARRVLVADEAIALRRLVDLWRDKYGAEWVADWYVERGRIPVRLQLTPS